MNSYRDQFEIKIKFYDILTQAPVYLISNFAAVGQILYGSSAVNNPWMIFVNDENQKNDVYDTLSRSFEKLWNHSESSPSLILSNKTKINNVFIGHGHDNYILEVTKNYLTKLEFLPKFYEKDQVHGKTIIENVEKLTAICSCAIIILTKDDFSLRARQNVIHELGWCQALYGRKNVYVAVEAGTELPSNIDGLNPFIFNKSNIKEFKRSLKKFFSK